MNTPTHSDNVRTSAKDSPSGEKLTPEERLFKIIEEEGVSPGAEGAGNPGHWFKKLFFSGEKGWKPRFDLAMINRVLVVGAVLTLAGDVLNVLLVNPDLSRIHERVANANTPSAVQEKTTERRPIDDYLYTILRRNLFEGGGKPPPGGDSTMTNAVIPSGNIMAVLDNLELVGIAWGQVPEAMIRKKNDNRTFFIGKGEKFEQILVKDILKDRVIVEYGQQTRELM